MDTACSTDKRYERCHASFVSENMRRKKNHVGAPRRRWLANIQYGLRSVLCVISSFRREADENRTLLGHYSGLTETHATVSNAFLCPSWQASGVGSCGHGNEA